MSTRYDDFSGSFRYHEDRDTNAAASTRYASWDSSCASCLSKISVALVYACARLLTITVGFWCLALASCLLGLCWCLCVLGFQRPLSRWRLGRDHDGDGGKSNGVHVLRNVERLGPRVHGVLLNHLGRLHGSRCKPNGSPFSCLIG